MLLKSILGCDANVKPGKTEVLCKVIKLKYCCSASFVAHVTFSHMNLCEINCRLYFWSGYETMCSFAVLSSSLGLFDHMFFLCADVIKLFVS